MTVAQDAQYLHDVMVRESMQPRETWDVFKNYYCYAVGNAAQLWKKRTGAVQTDDDLEAEAAWLFNYLRRDEYLNPVEPGTRAGYAWVRKQLEANFAL